MHIAVLELNNIRSSISVPSFLKQRFHTSTHNPVHPRMSVVRGKGLTSLERGVKRIVRLASLQSVKSNHAQAVYDDQMTRCRQLGNNSV